MLRKPISFKQATVITVFLHVAAFIGIGLYSEINSYYSKIEREKHREALITKKPSKQSDWFAEPPRVEIVSRPSTKVKNQKSFEELTKLSDKDLEKELDKLFAFN